MAADFAISFYNSKAWHDCRTSFIKKRIGLCENCLKKGVYKPGKIVHHIEHITPDNIYNPEITLNHDNLMLLCHDCHEKIHTDKRYKFMPDGTVVER